VGACQWRLIGYVSRETKNRCCHPGDSTGFLFLLVMG
jgi:hypothetical protein